MSRIVLPAGGGRLAIASDLTASLNTFSAHRMKTDKDRRGNSILVLADKTDYAKTLDLSNLKWCSETLDISSNIKDFVLTEIPANNVGIPNRNLDCFDFDAVTRWRPELGRVAFHTYRWKASNANHDNKDPLKAKGVIFDSYLKKISGHWHVMVVCGWCRQKDPVLAQRIADGRDAGYSMACLVGEARCSICGFKSAGGNVTCRHVNGGIGKGTIWKEAHTSKLVFEYCDKLNYFELSHVEDRADVDCISHWRA